MREVSVRSSLRARARVPAEIQERLFHDVDAVIDGGNCGLEPTSVVDLEGPAPVIARRGKGDVSAFESTQRDS